MKYGFLVLRSMVVSLIAKVACERKAASGAPAGYFEALGFERAIVVS